MRRISCNRRRIISTSCPSSRPGSPPAPWKSAAARDRDWCHCQNGPIDKPTNIDDYIAGHAGSVAAALAELRSLSRRAAPETGETLKWGHPAMIHPDGVIMFVFSAHKDHVNFVVTPSTLAAFKSELAGFTTGKGRIEIPQGGTGSRGSARAGDCLSPARIRAGWREVEVVTGSLPYDWEVSRPRTKDSQAVLPEQTRKWVLRITVVVLALVFALTSVMASGLPTMWLGMGDGSSMELIAPSLLH